MANNLEELPIYSKAREFTVAVDAILGLPRVRADRELWKQISAANDSVLANMHEGFEQPTDDGFAKYLYYSKGSVAEIIGHLRRAREKQHITEQDLQVREEMADVLAKMLGGFIGYLHRSGFKDRGRFKH